MKIIKIGTRDSELALWQANTVKNELEKSGYQTQLVPVKSVGDKILDKPLYELGITGIFTKALDAAMLEGEIDIAVHSMKDVPTVLPKGIVKAAVLKRAATQDILVYKNKKTLEEKNTIIASGSLRRKAQWLHRYPEHQVVDLRGNVNTRLKKLEDNDWGGAIFAKAGLNRIGLTPENHIDLDWMVPAPAQGAMLVVAMENDTFCREALSNLNDKETDLCTYIERDFLKELEGGCTAPIGALATISSDTVHFEGVLFSLDGRQKKSIKKTIKVTDSQGLGKKCAQELLMDGGREMMIDIKNELN